MFKNLIVWGVLRHVATAVGGGAVALGYVSGEQIQSVIGAVVTVVGVVASIRAKIKA